MRGLLLGLAVLVAGPALSVECRQDTFEGKAYSLCEVMPEKDELRLFLRDEAGEVFGHFGTLEEALNQRGESLGFAMNAGMYHEDRSPVGLYQEREKEARGLIKSAGPGNFGLLPNGVLCLRPGRADVIETSVFAANRPDCLYATQSGPMLVIEGALHPRFLPDSTSHYIRNGVGTTADGRRAVFVISDEVVTFHEFARFFRDRLELPNALYLDGNVSRIRAPELGRDDKGFTDLGPIIGVVTQGRD